MAWYDQLNPFDTENGHLWDYVPVAAGARSLARGESGWKAAAGFTPLAPQFALGEDIVSVAKKAKGAVDDVYGEKAKGYDAIRAEVERLKQERKGQKDFAYNLANSKYQPTRDAIAAVYGDPKGWKL